MYQKDSVNNLILQACALALDVCIDTCQDYINTCQIFSDKCSSGINQECAQEVGMCKNKSKLSIAACQEVVINCQNYNSESTIPAIIELMEQAIRHARSCEKACTKTLEHCHNDTKSCNDAILEGINQATLCSQACMNALQALNNEEDIE